MQKAHLICFLYFTKPKKRRKVLFILGVNQGIQIIGLLIFFSQYEINERTMSFSL